MPGQPVRAHARFQFSHHRLHRNHPSPSCWSPALCGARRFGLLRVRRLAFAVSCGLLRAPLCLPCAACRFDSIVGTLRCRLPWFVPLPDCSGDRTLRFRWPAFALRFEAVLSDYLAAQRLRALPRSRIAPRSMPERRVVCRLFHARRFVPRCRACSVPFGLLRTSHLLPGCLTLGDGLQIALYADTSTPL